MLPRRISYPGLFFSLILAFTPLLSAQDEAEKELSSGAPAREQVISPVNSQNKISLDIKGMDIIDVLKIFANRSGMNIVIGKNVTGRVTLFLKDVDLWDAFEIILTSNELAYEKKGDIINVMTQRDYELVYGDRYGDKKQARTMQLKYAKAADLSRALMQIKTNIGKIVVDEGSNTLVMVDTPQKVAEMEEFIRKTDLPLKTQVFLLNYAQAEKLSAKIQEALTKGVGTLKIDERTNKIAITDYPEKIEEISKLIFAFDEKTQQVLIDAQIIELKPTDKFEMGVDWEYWIRRHFKITSALPIGTVGRMVIGTPNVTPTAPGQYKAIIDALRTLGDSKILSSPRIMALNNQEARIMIGTKEPYASQTTTIGDGGATTTAETVTFVDVGIKLYVTPTINRDGFVTMKIRPEISSTGVPYTTAKGEKVPVVSTSEAETSVMVKDGVTLIIGGLRKDELAKTVKKIPIVGDMPLLGVFFRSISDEKKKTDLVILLTPHIMSGEKTCTDFNEIKPLDGAVFKLVAGDLIKEGNYPKKGNQPAPGDNSGYYNEILQRVREVSLKDYPRDQSGEVGIAFSLWRDGSLAAEPVVYQSTNPVLSNFAVKAIKSASPYTAFPDSLDKPQESFKVSLSYQ